MSTTLPAHLSYDVFVSDGPPRAGDQRMPDGAPLVWSPLSSTLIFGAHDALLVDPPFTRTQTRAVGDWVSGPAGTWPTSMPPTGTATTGSAPGNWSTASPA